MLLISHDIQSKVKCRVEKNQRDYVLREQIKVIREELGEESPVISRMSTGRRWVNLRHLGSQRQTGQRN